MKPGDPWPTESLSATNTASPSSTAAAGTAEHDHHVLSAGAIAGISIGAAAVLVLAGALVFMCGRRGGQDMAHRRSTQTFPPPMVDSKHNPKSPDQSTFSTNHYSMPVVNEPYRANSPHALASSPPPMSPNSHSAYSTYSSAAGHPTLQSPLMAGVMGGTQAY